MHASNGILFHHESSIRGETFVTRKITRALARIKVGLQDCLYLGNLDSLRDWGHAKDYVRAQWMMLQQAEPSDFVVRAGAELDMTISWEGTGIDEIGIDSRSGKQIVAVDSRYYRPAEVETLLGDPSKAKQILGWEPEISFDELVREMVQTDLDLAKRDQLCEGNGFRSYRYYE